MPDPVGMKVVATWKIVECTDPTEYNTLSDANKALFALIISAGTVKYVEGTNVVNVLLAMFPSGVTHDKLVTLLA